MRRRQRCGRPSSSAVLRRWRVAGWQCTHPRTPSWGTWPRRRGSLWGWSSSTWRPSSASDCRAASSTLPSPAVCSTRSSPTRRPSPTAPTSTPTPPPPRPYLPQPPTRNGGRRNAHTRAASGRHRLRRRRAHRSRRSRFHRPPSLRGGVSCTTSTQPRGPPAQRRPPPPTRRCPPCGRRRGEGCRRSRGPPPPSSAAAVDPASRGPPRRRLSVDRTSHGRRIKWRRCWLL
mmetsp:Transcript_14492/g.25621  ORF Transcript_14492/g.25621 Transcript_14492/m.25621 type:complete len:230 (+) Transcript_14492:1180-1869(+)